MFELDINEDDIRLRKRHPITSTPPRDNSHANHSKPWRLSPTPPRTHSTPSPERERGRRPRRKLPSDRSNERIVRESSNHDERIRKPSDSGAESGHSARRLVVMQCQEYTLGNVRTRLFHTITVGSLS